MTFEYLHNNLLSVLQLFERELNELFRQKKGLMVKLQSYQYQ